MSTAAAPIRTTPKPLRLRLLWPFVGALLATAIAAGVAAGTGAVGQQPVLFLALVAFLVALDSIEGKLVYGGDLSPTGVPAIALALVFGPGGVIVAESANALKRSVVGRRPAVRNAFNLACLSLAGMAAWAVARPLPDEGAGVLLTGLAAGVAYFLANNVLLLGVWWLNEGGSPVRMFRERVLDSVPYELAYGVVAALLVLAERSIGLLALALVGVPVLALWFGQVQAMALTRHHVDELTEANAALRGMMQSTVESLARTIEARDPYTGGHTERVGQFAHAIAAQLGLADDELRAIAVGAVIHDIGKIGIPDAVLLKPGALSDEEWETMRRHPVIGSYILDELDLPEHAKAMVRHHHERFDGTGYPDGLAGEDIPLAARILTVADTIDAMTTDRPYRKALSMQVARAEIAAKAGTQFCPRVVAAALDAT